MHHGWDVTISEVSAGYSPLVAVSTMIDSYNPVVTFDMGKMKKIRLWNAKADKEIMESEVEISIGVFET